MKRLKADAPLITSMHEPRHVLWRDQGPVWLPGFFRIQIKKNPRNLESYPNELDLVGFLGLFGYVHEILRIRTKEILEF
jgi:hypothetical protein